MSEPTTVHQGASPRQFVPLVGIVLSLLLFGGLAVQVPEGAPFPFDLPIQLFVHARSTPTLDIVMHAASVAASTWVLLPLDLAVFATLVIRDRRIFARFWIVAISGAALLDAVAKLIFARSRPDLWVSLYPESSFSFPSGHAMNSMAAFVALSVLAWHTRSRWPILVLGAMFVLVVGVSRVYWGVHFPSDILAGWCAAIAWVLGTSLYFNNRATRR